MNDLEKIRSELNDLTIEMDKIIEQYDTEEKHKELGKKITSELEKLNQNINLSSGKVVTNILKYSSSLYDEEINIYKSLHIKYRALRQDEKKELLKPHILKKEEAIKKINEEFNLIEKKIIENWDKTFRLDDKSIQNFIKALIDFKVRQMDGLKKKLRKEYLRQKS